jgi:hypothetical protein
LIELLVEKECGCFKRSSFEAKHLFETKQEALRYANEMCEKMNIKFCHKHKFRYEEENEQILIKMEIAK